MLVLNPCPFLFKGPDCGDSTVSRMLISPLLFLHRCVVLIPTTEVYYRRWLGRGASNLQFDLGASRPYALETMSVQAGAKRRAV